MAAAAWFVYAPALQGAKLWDDKVELPGDMLGFSRRSLGRIWTGAFGNDYYPLKSTVQWVQSGWWGNDTLGFHLTSVGLHLLSAFLLWRLLGKLGLRQAWLGGLLLVVHPLAVESVAWLSELKNVLSLPPLLLAMCNFCDYESASRAAGGLSPGGVLPDAAVLPHPGRRLALSLFWFIVAMLCKSSVVMFPVVLLLYVWWRRGRIGPADLRASAAFFGVSLILGLVEVGYQHRAFAGEILETGGMLSRVAIAGLAATFYLFKSVFPVGLLANYPRWTVDPPSAVQFLPWIAMGLLLARLWQKREGYGRHALFGLGFFFTNLIPVLGFVPMSYQRISWVADHFAYLPMVGLIGLATAALQKWRDWHRITRSAITLAVAVVIVASAVASRGYARNFRSEKALWTYTLQHNPNAWPAHNNLGIELADSGQLPEALEQYREALRLKPNYAEAHNNLGLALVESGRLPEALEQYRQALRLKPDYPEAQISLGLALADSGRLPEALAHFKEALRLKPDYAEAHNNLGLALADSGRLPEAIIQYHEALRQRPDYAEAEYNLGGLLYAMGRAPEGIAHLERAVRIDPDFAKAHNNLGIALTNSRRFSEALAQFKEALRIRPDFPEAHYNLGAAFAAENLPSQAIREYEEALRQRPDYAEADNNLGVALAAAGRLTEALAPLQAAVKLKPGYAEAHENLGRILQAFGKRDEAEAQLKEAARLRAARH